MVVARSFDGHSPVAGPAHFVILQLDDELQIGDFQAGVLFLAHQQSVTGTSKIHAASLSFAILFRDARSSASLVLSIRLSYIDLSPCCEYGFSPSRKLTSFL